MAIVSSSGFAPIAGPAIHILVLGSLPGTRSLQAQQYYAHPRNAFWPIIEQVFGVRGNYRDRCSQLVAHGVGLWDVLASAARPGSLDARISLSTARANDIATFAKQHPEISRVVFNGKKAEQLFGRYIDTEELNSLIELRGLPSTSPAYAAMRFQDKLAAWREALEVDIPSRLEASSEHCTA
jgi:hypoxanthine-DNA glycosylase